MARLCIEDGRGNMAETAIPMEVQKGKEDG